MGIIGVSGYAGSGKDTVGHIVQWLSARKNYPTLTPESFEEFLNEHRGREKALLHYEQGVDFIFAPYVIKKWAGKLKQVASLISGIPIENFEDQQFKKTQLGIEWRQGWAVYIQDKEIKNGGEMQITGVLKDLRDAETLRDQYLERMNGRDKSVTVEIRPVEMTVRDFLQKLGTEGLRNGLHENAWVNALMCDYRRGDQWVITDTRFPNEAEAIKKKDGIIIRLEVPGLTPINAHESEKALDCYRYDYTIFNRIDEGYEPLIEKISKILKDENLI